MNENLNSILEVNSSNKDEKSLNDSMPIVKGRDPMSIPEILFSFSGRISRAEYWKGYLLLLPLGILNLILLYGIDSDGVNVFSMIIGVVCLWPGLALVVKRWHDRDRSTWWFLTLLIPFLGAGFAIWTIIEIWFLKGTDGPNRFGLDPLQNINES